MFTFECSWCEAELVVDDVDATTVDCQACHVTVDLAPDPLPLALAA